MRGAWRSQGRVCTGSPDSLTLTSPFATLTPLSAPTCHLPVTVPDCPDTDGHPCWTLSFALLRCTGACRTTRATRRLASPASRRCSAMRWRSAATTGSITGCGRPARRTFRWERVWDEQGKAGLRSRVMCNGRRWRNATTRRKHGLHTACRKYRDRRVYGGPKEGRQKAREAWQNPAVT